MSKIILCQNIKLDKEYNNVLNFSLDRMLNLCENNKIAEANDYSFIRTERNYISVQFSFAQCQRANYIAFQNVDYDNKWFFAFIDSVEYVSDNTTRLRYTIDVWSTFWDDWTSTTCFVIREHVSDDTRGLHTIPEGLETGDYMVCNETKMTGLGDNVNDFCYVLASTTSWLTKKDPLDTAKKQTMNGGGLYYGIYAGCKYYRMNNEDDVRMALSYMAEAGQLDNIVCIFIAPKMLCIEKDKPIGHDTYGDREIENILLPYTLGQNINKWDYIGSYVGNEDRSYIPHNNKLLCYPYSYLQVSNGVGASAIYKYEDFFTTKDDKMISFEADIVLCPSLSGKIIPRRFKGQNVNYEYGLPLGKFPICSFQTDAYTNWLVQNSVNIFGERISNDELNLGVSLASGLLGTGVSIATGNVAGATMGAVSTGVGVATSVQAMKNHELIPPQTTMAQSTGDVTTAMGYICPRFYNISITPEYARVIDRYFDKFGYKVNALKVPTFSSRPHWNYVQIGAGENIGYGSVPSSYMSIINNIFRKGVTIWHNHEEIGNYNLDNTIQ